jgi:hypothetical protein
MPPQKKRQCGSVSSFGTCTRGGLGKPGPAFCVATCIGSFNPIVLSVVERWYVSIRHIHFCNIMLLLLLLFQTTRMFVEPNSNQAASLFLAVARRPATRILEYFLEIWDQRFDSNGGKNHMGKLSDPCRLLRCTCIFTSHSVVGPSPSRRHGSGGPGTWTVAVSVGSHGGCRLAGHFLLAAA